MSSTMLELAISMMFLYLMLSAASSAIQEIIANIGRWRAKTLEKGIEGLFSKEFKDEFYKLPLIESLCSPNTHGDYANRPSYIAPTTFALAVLNLAGQKGMNLTGGSPAPVAPLQPGANVGVPESPAPNQQGAPPATDPFAKPAELLRSLLVGAKDLEEQRQRLENWFNDSMDRVSGWYKRTAHAWLWIIGIALAILVNADSISLANLFWNDPTLRAATVEAAKARVAKGNAGSSGGQTATSGTTSATTNSNAGPSSGQTATGGATPAASSGNPGSSGGKTATSGTTSATTNSNAGPSSGQTATGGATPAAPSGNPGSSGGQPTTEKSTIEALNDVKRDLAQADIPLGWCWQSKDSTRKCFPVFTAEDKSPTDSKHRDPRMIMSFSSCSETALWWFWKIVGLTLTGLAISQGAPFWFDLLQKAVNLRLAGDAPNEKPQKK